MARAALRQRGSLSVWFDPDTVWHAGTSGKRGRPETFSDAAIQVCLTLKVLFGLPLRQTVGLVESLIRMAGLDWPVPDYSTLCRRQARIGVQIPYRRFGKPLNLLIDGRAIVRHRSEDDGEGREVPR
ncbi:Transposase DDE domain-containing protein [Allgaiera indica]|uniref:Transposase DDE domain-containing protein n=1 Tax=Allgaiera indica TaxID=765699 RepID=A0A1H3FV24_9RHOB|nr:Transposase DDE domain-containing protein [Allgaiera indica]